MDSNAYLQQIAEEEIRQLTDELHDVRMRTIRCVEQTRHGNGPLEIRKLRRVAEHLMPLSTASVTMAIRDLITAAAERCANREALRELYLLDSDEHGPQGTPQEGYQRALERVGKWHNFSQRTRQDEVAALRRELAEAIYELSVSRDLPQPNFDREAELQWSTLDVATVPDLLSRIHGELQAMCADLGVTIRKIRDEGPSLRQLRATEYEYRRSVLDKEGEDRARAAYRVLDCASDRTVSGAARAILRCLLNFGEYAVPVEERRRRLVESFGLAPDIFEAFEHDTFEAFSDYLANAWRSPCRQGQGGFETGEPHIGPDERLRMGFGLAGIEDRPDNHERLIRELLERLSEADRIARELISGNPSPITVYTYIVERVIATQWVRPAIGERDKARTRVRTSMASPSLVSFMLGLGAPRYLLEEEVDEAAIARRLVPGTLGFRGDYYATKARVLDEFLRLVLRIDRRGAWDAVLRIDGNPEGVLVPQPAPAPTPVPAQE